MEDEWTVVTYKKKKMTTNVSDTKEKNETPKWIDDTTDMFPEPSHYKCKKYYYD